MQCVFDVVHFSITMWRSHRLSAAINKTKMSSSGLLKCIYNVVLHQNSKITFW